MALLTGAGIEFVTERHLATLTTLRADGSPHVTAVGFTWDEAAGAARIICSATSQKVRNVTRRPRVAICQVDGPRWLTVEGAARVSDDPDEVADAVERYARRYRQPRVNPARVTLIVIVDRVLGSPRFRPA